ncbi:MAG TPA: hypothetical protein DHV59_05060 [Oxalobacteraceae bacterium]|nr:hypothetical protein [Oxalobacteraceae bacterium]
MRLSRSSRFATALVALVCVLFAQLAMAAYACPGLQIAEWEGMAEQMAADAGQHGMPDCETMDTEQPAMCHAHLQAGDQSLDKPGTPHLPAAVAQPLMSALVSIDAAYLPAASHAHAPWLRRSSGPPLSIQHCCFRI